VKADIELDGQILRDVGLRFKGNGTYMMSASGRKRPFKVDFNRFVDDQRFHGLQQLNLHNNVMDPTQVRQAISYPVFQTAGVPSPRTSFAEVFLTIDGECDRERLGLYTVVEEVDKAFLRRHFKTSKGMLLKPEGTQGLEYKGEDWAAYEWYEPKSKPKKSESQRLIDGLRLIHQADDDQFRREIGNYLEIDEFARFLAANTLLSNMDSFLTHVHNYYLYLPPSTNKFVVLPWDMDLSMGAFFMAGSAEQLQDLSISHPHVGANKLLDRLLEWDEFNGIYREHLRRLTETCFGEQGETLKNLALVRVAIKDQVDADLKSAARTPTSFGPPGGMFGGAPALEVFFTKRRESILSQLAGKSKGQAPGMSFGPRPGQGPGGPPGGPGGFGPGNFHGPQIVRAADKNQDQKLTRVEFLELAATWQKAWDKDKNDSLSSDEIVAGMNESLGPPANAAFKPPAGFGPGNFMGPSLLKLASTDQDDALSNREWVGLFGKWFQEWDMDQDENLVETEVVAGFNKAFAPPPGIRPPGFGPPPPGSGPAVPSAPDTPRRP
jgi:spore coat protein CotH